MDPSHVTAVGAMLAWAYFVALWRSDWIRAPLILIALQQFMQAHVDVFSSGLLTGAASTSARSILLRMQARGLYDEDARSALMIALAQAGVGDQALLQAMPPACISERCPAHAGAAAAGQWAATSLIPLYADQTLTLWSAWNVANAAAPQDTGVHLQTWAQNMADGVDTTAAHPAVATPEQVTTSMPPQVPATATTTSPDATDTSFFIPGQVVARATDPIWYWAIGTVAVVTVGIGLLFFPRPRRRSRA